MNKDIDAAHLLPMDMCKQYAEGIISREQLVNMLVEFPFSEKIIILFLKKKNFSF